MQNLGLENLKNIKCVIFDFDGTLCDLNIDWKKGFKKLEKDILQKFPLDEDEFDRLDIELKINNRVKKYGSEFKTAIDEFTSDYENSEINGYKINKDIIEKYKEKTLCIWSGNSIKLISKILKKEKLYNNFSLILGFDSVMYNKPEIEGFQIIQKELGFKNNEFLMIGNSEIDKLACSKSNISYLDIEDVKI